MSFLAPVRAPFQCPLTLALSPCAILEVALPQWVSRKGLPSELQGDQEHAGMKENALRK